MKVDVWNFLIRMENLPSSSKDLIQQDSMFLEYNAPRSSTFILL